MQAAAWATPLRARMGNTTQGAGAVPIAAG